MSKFGDPMNFASQLVINGKKITYANLLELCQGCPAVGDLAVDGKKVSALRFGGPMVGHERYIYAPAYNKRFWTSGFRLARVDTTNLKVKLIGSVKNLIFLNKVEDGYIYFFEDLEGTKKNRLRVSDD